MRTQVNFQCPWSSQTVYLNLPVDIEIRFYTHVQGQAEMQEDVSISFRIPYSFSSDKECSSKDLDSGPAIQKVL